MASLFSIFNIKTWLIRKKIEREQLNLYYPKKVYDPLARKEMKGILTHFNEVFYHAYPEMMSDSSDVLVDYHPRSHGRQYDIQRAVKLCKSQKVRRKDLVKIEEYLNLQYIIEVQLAYYNQKLQKATSTKNLLSEEAFSSFYPALFEERMNRIERRESYSQTKIRKLEKEKQMCEKAIRDLMHSNHSFWGDARKLIGGMVAESVKHAVDMVDQSFRRK